MVEASTIVAALGPTNTGKTHRAIERMLEHDTGMIGLPLRLLAREVYDRVSTRIGEERVALVTGEEKRIPRRPAYWVCTVEAMPMDREVDFLAVDEIQLCAHRERGHVFTDRLLCARGRHETWFLGSDTMRPMVDRLVPTAMHRRFHRLSRLRYVGPRSLRSLPPRSAVVGFSTDQVYEAAERLRRLRGGVAVVLGALSPRTRNAQVAMYQAGEVQYLVATDAIGMGLNLDVDHVAFGALRKFDGREQRSLRVDELAQIAGRAGRHLNDGSFGVLRPLPELPPPVARAIEEHHFQPVRKVVWRSSDLDFSSLDALLASLVIPPRHPALERVSQADDFDALKALSQNDDIRRLARGEDRIALLWEVCQIPDFRKLLLHRHAGLLHDIYRQLCEGDGRLDDGWLSAQVRRIDDLRGGIDTLTARLAAVRTWTYVSHRADWLRDAVHWQERTRAIEDALGDALHERLVERFVERAGTAPRRRLRRGRVPARTVAPSGPFAALQALADDMEPDEAAETEQSFVQRVVEAPHEAFGVDRGGLVRFEDEPLARLVRGRDLLAPEVVLDEGEGWTAGARARLERRLVALGRDIVHEAVGGFRSEGWEGVEGGASARGLAYRIERGLGIVRLREARAQWDALAGPLRELFVGRGVTEGRRFLFVEEALSPTALERRRMLVPLWLRHAAPADVPGEPLVPARVFRDDEEAELLGYERLGPHALRIDILERLLVELGGAHAPGAETPLLDELDVSGKERAGLLGALGYQERGTGPERVISPRSRRSRRRRRRRRRRGSDS